jgi:hypothetical protein
LSSPSFFSRFSCTARFALGLRSMQIFSSHLGLQFLALKPSSLPPPVSLLGVLFGSSPRAAANLRSQGVRKQAHQPSTAFSSSACCSFLLGVQHARQSRCDLVFGSAAHSSLVFGVGPVRLVSCRSVGSSHSRSRFMRAGSRLRFLCRPDLTVIFPLDWSAHTPVLVLSSCLVIKCIYLLTTYLYFMQDIKCIYLPF